MRRETRSGPARSEEHTSELQSQSNLVCRLLLDKKTKTTSQSDCQYRGRRWTVTTAERSPPDVPRLHDGILVRRLETSASATDNLLVAPQPPQTTKNVPPPPTPFPL